MGRCPCIGAGENRDAAYQKIMHAYTHSIPDLDLSGLNLTSLPRQLGELLSLTTLNLSHNQLTQLPEEIAQLTNLLALEISPLSDFYHEIEHSALSEVIHQCYIKAKQPYRDELKAQWNAIATDVQK